MERDTNVSFSSGRPFEKMVAALPGAGIVEVWKSELRSRLDTFVNAFQNFQTAESALYHYISKSPQHLNHVECVEEVIFGWIKERCSEASSQASNMGHLAVTPDRLPKGLGHYCFPRKIFLHDADPEIEEGVSVFKATVRELADFAMKEYDFSGFYIELNKLSSSIEESGFVDAAQQLGATFGFTRRQAFENQPLYVKKQKGRYILELRHYYSWVHDRINSLNTILTVARTFEAESGTRGLVDCVIAAIGEERKIVRFSDAFVVSRTKIAEGGDVEGVFFKDKIKLAFKSDVFEALVGFIRSYATSVVNDIEVE